MGIYGGNLKRKEKMTELATAYFDEDDTQSDTFYPILSTLN